MICSSSEAMVNCVQTKRNEAIVMLTRTAEPNLTGVPEALFQNATKYELRRETYSQCSHWPSYREMHAMLADKRLSFEDIARKIGTTREAVRNICNNHFPNIRPVQQR